MINLQDNSFENDASIKFILNNLSTIIQQAYVLEEKISQKIFTDIEAMILNSENSIVLELDWQTTIWEISAKFEFRELWFTPQSWIHPKADEKHSNILHSYAFLSSLIITEGTITILMKNFRLIITDSRLLTFLGTIKDI
jgi:hypothetical protein